MEPGARVVLGRDPSPEGPAHGQVVPGDASSVSKAHLLVDFDGTPSSSRTSGPPTARRWCATATPGRWSRASRSRWSTATAWPSAPSRS